MEEKNKLYLRWGKRTFDLLMAVPSLIILAPLMAIIAILVRYNLGSPIIFRQNRTGLQGDLFISYKFRTMTDDRDAQGKLLPDEKRLTSIGKFLRKTSLDELPGLWNVLKGDMSLVGPRPLLPEYLEHYTPEQMRRHEVKPGITGWAQVNGRNAITWEEKFKYDVSYVKHMSFQFDMKILLLTIWKTLKGENINQPGEATVEKFKGTRG